TRDHQLTRGQRLTMRVTAFHSSLHLSEDQLEEPARNCRLCACAAPTVRFALQLDPTVELLQCPRCAGCSASRMPTAEALDAYYGRYYEDRVSAGDHVTVDDARVLSRRITEYVSRHTAGS